MSKRKKQIAGITLKEGEKLYWFSAPWDRKDWGGYRHMYRASFHNATVRTVTPDGKYAVIYARLSGGGMHTVRVKVSDLEIIR